MKIVECKKNVEEYVLELNPREFRLDRNEKASMIKETIVTMEIGIMLFSSTDRWWAQLSIDIIKNRLKGVSKK